MNSTANPLTSEQPIAEPRVAIRAEWGHDATVVRTWLTSDELAEHDLQVVEVSHVRELATLTQSAPGAQALRWLERRSIKTHTRHTSVEHSWRSALCDRVGELRALAVEENLLFSETSAKAAMRFVDALDEARRPGAFLVHGNIRLVWRTANGEQVGLQFLENDKIQFVYLERDGDELGHTMGTGSREMVLRALKAPVLTRILNG